MAQNHILDSGTGMMVLKFLGLKVNAVAGLP